MGEVSGLRFLRRGCLQPPTLFEALCSTGEARKGRNPHGPFPPRHAALLAREASGVETFSLICLRVNKTCGRG